MQRMLHMGDDSELFKNERQLADMNMIFFPPNWLEDSEIRFIPLMEAKLCHQYDHRAATFEGIPWDDRFGTHPATRELTLGEHNNPHATPLPRYWVPRTEISNRIPGRAYLLAFRDSVSAIADSRSLVASIVPPNGAGDTLKFIFPTDAREMTFLCAWLNSFATDYLFRLKASGAHASFFLLRQLPIPSHDVLSETQAWSSPVAVGDFVLRRVLELTYTAWDLQPFALDVGYDGPPFRWDPERRILLRAELDAAFFHLYGLSRDDTAYILDTFPIVKKNDEKAHGEYRTRRVILEIYDAMAAAAQRGVPYPTRLSPPPADFSVAHPPRPPAAPRSAP